MLDIDVTVGSKYAYRIYHYVAGDPEPYAASRKGIRICGPDTGPGPQDIKIGNLTFGLFGGVTASELGFPSWLHPASIATDQIFFKMAYFGKILFVNFQNSSTLQVDIDLGFTCGGITPKGVRPSNVPEPVIADRNGYLFHTRVSKLYDYNNTLTIDDLDINKDGTPFGVSETLDFARFFLQRDLENISAPFYSHDHHNFSEEGYVVSDYSDTGEFQQVTTNINPSTGRRELVLSVPPSTLARPKFLVAELIGHRHVESL